MDMGNLLFGDQQQPQQQQPLPAPIQAPEPSFTEKLRTDPALMQSMLMAGARLLQGPAPGQDVGGLFGDAVMIGSATHNMMKENEYANARADEEMRRRNALAEAQMGQLQANTESTQLETSQKKQSFPETQKKVALEIKKLTAEGKRAEAMALKEEYNSNPARLAEAWNLDVAKDKAQINASNASAGASASSAEFNRERTKGAKAENSAFDVLNNPLADDRAVEASARALNKGKTDKAGAKASADMLKQTIREAHPDWTEQQVAEEALARGGTSKTDPVTLARKVLETPEEYPPEDVANARAIVGQTLASTVNRKAGGKPTAPVATAAPAADRAAWEKARNSVAPGEMYTGPDGKQYRRGK